MSSDKFSEDDTCRMYVIPKLTEAGWNPDKIRGQVNITNGRIIPDGRGGKRGNKKRPDYILYYAHNYKIAVVEAKSLYETPDQGMQQAIEYAELLKLKFAYATNGRGIEEYDFITKKQTTLDRFPSPQELWARLNCQLNLNEEKQKTLLQPFDRMSTSPDGKIMEPRYYQEIAVNAAITSILHGRKRVLLTLATGTGKTYIAYQIARKLFETVKPRPKILYLADRDALLTQAIIRDFAPFGEAIHRIQRKVEKSKSMYFALYQALDVDREESQLYKQYPSDFFDYVMIDECHRGGGREESNWHDILNYFSSAIHVGMTATPRRDADSLDTYDYFGAPVYEYSLKQGIEDGFLAPYFVVRPILDIDQTGYVPKKDERDNDGRLLEQKTYSVNDFDRTLIYEERRKTVAQHLTDFMEKNGKYDKTILFCQKSEHAAGMTKLLRNYSGEGPTYCVRIVSDEGDVGKTHLYNFTDYKKDFPVIAVTSKLMSTGIDAPTCRVIALDKTINSMTEFKQIIGRGTRVFEARDKLWFTIIDYRGVTRLFNDEDWDGPAEGITQEQVETITREKEERLSKKPQKERDTRPPSPPIDPTETFVIDGAEVKITGESVMIFDPALGVHKLITYQDYTGETVRRLVNDYQMQLEQIWINPEKRQHFVNELEKRGITLNHLRQVTQIYKADTFDLLLHFAFNSQLKTRLERVDTVRKKKTFLEKYPQKAREVLDIIMQHYAEYGYQELEGRQILDLDDFKKFGGPVDIINDIFENGDKYDQAISELTKAIYSET